MIRRRAMYEIGDNENQNISNGPLTITALEDGLIVRVSLKVEQLSYVDPYDDEQAGLEANTDPHIKYSVDGNTWIDFFDEFEGETGTYDIPISLNNGESIYFTGNLKPRYDFDGVTVIAANGPIGFRSANNKRHSVSGNPLSVIYNDGADKYLGAACQSMFRFDYYLIDASGLQMGTDTAPYCFDEMFESCTRLENAPELPSLNVNYASYYKMFANCTSLVTAPKMPYNANLEYASYANMFNGCTSLVNGPTEINATMRPATCENMFKGCISLTKAPKLTVKLAEGCFAHMFSGCTSLVLAPELYNEVLVKNCYKRMFYGCSSLNYIKAGFTTTPGIDYTANWLDGVADTGTFVKRDTATWNVTGVDGVPLGWTVLTSDFED